MYESTLFTDLQAAVPGDFCPVCGSERYLPGLTCLRCERRFPDDDDGTEQDL